MLHCLAQRVIFKDMIGCRLITNEEAELIRSSLKTTRDRALFTLNLLTGFRIAESLSLKVGSVYRDGVALDRVTVERRNMKGKVASRTVLLHPKAKAALVELIKDQHLEESDYLFQSNKGVNKPIGRIQAWKVLKAAVNEHKLQGKVALHSTRKAFAEKMYIALGKDLVKTSKALGHVNITSTVAYLSFNTEELDTAILGQ